MSSEILFQSVVDIKQDDFDYLIMFLESRRQSGGGDMKKTEKLNSKEFRVEYEMADAAARILERRFFKFKNYEIRAKKIGDGSDSDKSLNKDKLVIKNLSANDDYEKQNHESIVRLYADHLSPDNEILQVEKSTFLVDTFYVTYEKELDMDLVKKRYEKKSLIRQQKIELFDSFNIKTLLVWSRNLNNNEEPIKSEIIREKISSLIRQTSDDSQFFIDQTDKYILIEFSEAFRPELKNLLQTNLTNLSANLLVENLHNFDLLKYFDQIESKSFDLTLIKNEPSEKKAVEYSSKVDQEKTADLKLDETKKFNSQLVGPDQFVLDSDQFYARTMLKCKQVLVNFDLYLKKKNPKLSANISHEPRFVYIQNLEALSNDKDKKNEIDWKSHVAKIIDEFFTSDSLYQQIKLGQDVLTNRDILLGLHTILYDTNSQYSNTNFFEIKSDGILHAYGLKKTLTKNLDRIREYLKQSKCKPSNQVGEAKPSRSSSVLSTASTYTTAKSTVNSDQDPLANNFIIQIDQNSLLHLAMNNIEAVRAEFSLKVNSQKGRLECKNANCSPRKSYFIECPKNAVNNVQNLIDSYESKQLLKININLSKPVALNKQNLTELKVQILGAFNNAKKIKFQFNIIDGKDFLLCYGFADAVCNFEDQCKQKYNNLVNKISTPAIVNPRNSHRHQRKKNSPLSLTNDQIIITAENNPLDFVVLSRFKGKYFNDIVTQLKKFNCNITKSANGSSYAINLAGYADKNYMLNLAKNYFADFKQKVMQITQQEFNQANFKYDKNSVDLVWLSANELELTAHKNHFYRLMGLIQKMQRGAKDGVTSSSSSIKYSSESEMSNSNVDTSINSKKVSRLNAARRDSVSSSSSSVQPFTSSASSATAAVASMPDLPKDTFLINDLKWYQTRILFEKKYFKYLSETFVDLKVLLDTDLTRVLFTGSKPDIKLAKDLAFDILNEIIGAEIEVDDQFLSKLISNETQYSNLIKSENLVCVLDTKTDSKNKFTIFATSVEDLQKCKDLILEAKF
jgi:hypothetical protein